jgi:hypothetical protein
MLALRSRKNLHPVNFGGPHLASAGGIMLSVTALVVFWRELLGIEELCGMRRTNSKNSHPQNGNGAVRSSGRHDALKPTTTKVTELNAGMLLAELEAENMELREQAVDLVLEIQSLRDGRLPSGFPGS